MSAQAPSNPATRESESASPGLWKSLQFCVPAFTGSLDDIITGTKASILASRSPSFINDGVAGSAFSFDRSPVGYGTPEWSDFTGDFTLVAMIEPGNRSDINTFFARHKTGNPPNSEGVALFYNNYEKNDRVMQADAVTSSTVGTAKISSGDGLANNGATNVVIFRRNGETCELFSNSGKNSLQLSGAFTPPSDAPLTIGAFSDNFDGFWFTGYLYHALGYDLALTDEQVQSYVEDPFVPFRRAAANVGAVNLNGLLNPQSAFGAHLTRSRFANGRVDAIPALAGALSRDRSFTGPIAAKSAFAAALRIERVLDGHIGADALFDGKLGLQIGGTMTLLATSSLNGVLRAWREMNGALVGASTLTGVLAEMARYTLLAGGVTARSSFNTVMTADRGVRGTVSALGTLSGQLSRDVDLSGEVGAVARLLAALAVDRYLNGQAMGIAEMTGVLESMTEGRPEIVLHAAISEHLTLRASEPETLRLDRDIN